MLSNSINRTFGCRNEGFECTNKDYVCTFKIYVLSLRPGKTCLLPARLMTIVPVKSVRFKVNKKTQRRPDYMRSAYQVVWEETLGF